MSWLRYSVVVLLLCLIGTVCGCKPSSDSVGSGDSKSGGPTAESKTASSNAKKGKVAVVISTLNNPWFVVLADAAKGRAEELGFEATVFDCQNDPSKEVAYFETILAGGYEAILFNPTDSDGSVANVRMAKERGIPVFCMDREVNATDVAAAQILSDNYAGCIEIGQYFVEQLENEGEYVELLGLTGDNNTKNRSQGFHSVVDRSNLKMVAQQPADFDRAKALSVMESLLQSNPNIKGVFCGNDNMAMGAYQAIDAAGKSSQIKIFGFDGNSEVVKMISEGKIAATGMQFPKKMAQLAAEFADQWHSGKRDFQQKIPVAVELVTIDNVGEYGDYGRTE